MKSSTARVSGSFGRSGARWVAQRLPAKPGRAASAQGENSSPAIATPQAITAIRQPRASRAPALQMVFDMFDPRGTTVMP